MKRLITNDCETWVAENKDHLAEVFRKENGYELDDLDEWRVMDDNEKVCIGFEILEADDGDHPDTGNVEIPRDAKFEQDDERPGLQFYVAIASEWANCNEPGFLCGEE